jgi:glucosamine--fructose-6-phosphate aminotransferase (isomerizing)
VAVTGDGLLARALASEKAQLTVLGHTRWASVGLISEPNAHPLSQEEEGEAGAGAPHVAAALNGDVDNHDELRTAEGLRFSPEITTDAKIIPALVSRRMREGQRLDDAFRSTVARFEGSVAIAATTAEHPDRVLLALRGSGQALYVGLAEDAFVVASEPYGLVQETPIYLRLDGETPAPSGSQGQVVVLSRRGAGSPDGIRRLTYAGEVLPVQAGELQTAQVTTRDIDRAGFPHYLLKELSQSPASFRKTLRGRIADADGRLSARLGDDALPPALRARLTDGTLRRIVVIGQGTAAVAASSTAAAISHAVRGTGLLVDAMPASELSGFGPEDEGLGDDLSDMLVVAISQSGTTTDTNRTVDLVRARGALVVAIINRRNSDLVEKAHAVLFTSDGRDVEMSVPSTKAFYAQVAAGFLLASALGQELGSGDPRETGELLAGLRLLPDAMETVLAHREEIAVAAARFAPSRRHWAVVGNGLNRIAAQELRIKISELCYKSIACDATEDKKHIDLSSEPLILVCAAGLAGPTADDVAKEIAIFRAHKAAPIVIATDGTSFAAALHTISVPPAHPRLAFLLATVAGHLFGYEAALSIDGQARPLREARAAIEASAARPAPLAGAGDALLDRLAVQIGPSANRFLDELRAGAYDGTLEASTATRIASLLRYAEGIVPLEAYPLEHGKLGTPATCIGDLTDALTRGIEELTRPIDAIKHQAKTVTVGISRQEESLLDVPLVAQLLAAGALRDRLSYRALRTLAALDPGVAEVTGYTRYRIEGSVADDRATIHVVDQGGVARSITSRTASNPALRGTKHRAAFEREVTVVRGHDGRTVLLVPEAKHTEVTGMTLLHVRLHETLAPDAARAVLTGYRHRYGALADAVTETEAAFDDSRLADVALVDLLVQPVHVLASRWRGG